jgi:hypothetical protein
MCHYYYYYLPCVIIIIIIIIIDIIIFILVRGEEILHGIGNSGIPSPMTVLTEHYVFSPGKSFVPRLLQKDIESWFCSLCDLPNRTDVKK